MFPKRIWVHVLSLLLGSGGACLGEDVFRCALRLQLQQEKGVDSEWNGFQNATATLIRVPQSANADYYTADFYLVTAYHSIWRKTLVRLQLPGGQIPIGKIDDMRRDAFTEPNFLVDRVLDLAVFKIIDKDRLKRLVDDGHVTPIELLAPSNRLRGSADIPTGARASAVGNPRLQFSGVAKEPDNVAYGCTVSEYETTVRRVSNIVVRGHELENQALDVERIFLESFSIDKGFSGGPVIQYLDNEARTGTLVGIIIGGVASSSNVSGPGRFVWACPASAIRQRLANYTSASEKLDFPTTADVWNMYDPPYRLAEAYSFEDEWEVDFPTANTRFTQADYNVYAEVFRNKERFRLTFRGLNLEDVDLGKAFLANAYFERCTFLGVDFSNAVLTGAIFQGCDLEERAKPLVGHGIRYVNCNFGFAFDAPSEFEPAPPAPPSEAFEAPTEAEADFFESFAVPVPEA